MSDAIKFAGVALECPDAPGLAAFYAEVTGGAVTFADSQWVTLTVPDGRKIDFQTSPGHVAPKWPDPAASMQMHLDFVVDDLDATETRVLAAGATKFQVQPNWHCRVFADPAGHPFCLSMQETAGELEL